MDLYADLPPDAKGGGTASGVSKPSVSSTGRSRRGSCDDLHTGSLDDASVDTTCSPGFLMPPPKRPRAGSSGTMLPPPALVKPKLPSPQTPAAQPAMIHSQLDVQRPVLAQVRELLSRRFLGEHDFIPRCRR
jgi:hypothetical protein